MKNKILVTPTFENRYKKFLKKYPSLKDELSELESELIENPSVGTSLGANLYKIRLSNKEKGKGKSGGFRIVTYLVEETKPNIEIFLIIIYNKSEESSISKSELIKLAKAIHKK